MLNVRPAAERGHFQGDWLDSYHTFSFDTFYDPRHMGYRDLRVINEDWVSPGHGFPLHPHRDMEILTFIVDGALEHRDNLGHREIIHAGEVQHMTAGRGIQHSEFNPSSEEPVHLLQIWIVPDHTGLEPGYEVRRFGDGETGLRLLASPDGRSGSARLAQDAAVYGGTLAAGTNIEYHSRSGRHTWLQVVDGNVSVNGVNLGPGDGAASDDADFQVKSENGARVVVFDLA